MNEILDIDGVKIKWFKKNLYSEPDYKIINVSNDIHKKILETRPVDIPIFQQKSVMFVEYFTSETIKNELSSELGNEIFGGYIR